MPNITVIICAHNSRETYLRRTLEGLQAQTLSTQDWELVLVDNASSPPLSERFSVDWHPQGWLVLEPEAGLTKARLRGIAEAKGELLIFVDDDNVLAEDYLETAQRLMATHRWLGAIGGALYPEYEVPPPEPFFNEQLLAIRRPKESRWSNVLSDWESQPWGAGLVIRKVVCEAYQETVGRDPRRHLFGRKGNSLSSAEDIDMVYHCHPLGMGFGVFTELSLTHLIPKERLEADYLNRLWRGVLISNWALAKLWNRPG
ncbi:MAG: glycosyltransferase, partial [Verrucomicrobiota bacterium]